MAPAGRPHPVVFVFVSALLVLSGVVFSRSKAGVDAEGDVERPVESPTLVVQRVEAETASLHAQVEESAERFLPAFLRYEVGDIGPYVRRELLTFSTEQLGTALLAIPPKRPPAGRFPPPARLRGLEVTFPNAAFKALVKATAIRGGKIQGLSFEFEYVEGEWLASGFTE